MSRSVFCIEQRIKQQHQSRKIIFLGIVGSFIFHSAIALAMSTYEPPTIAEDPIELIIIEEPEEKPEIPKPKPEIPKPKEVNKPEPESLPPPPKETPKIVKIPQKTEIPKPFEKPVAKVPRKTEVPEPVVTQEVIKPIQPQKPIIATKPTFSQPNLPPQPTPEPEITPTITPEPITSPKTPIIKSSPSALATTSKRTRIMESSTPSVTAVSNDFTPDAISDAPVVSAPSSMSRNRNQPTAISTGSNSQGRQTLKNSLTNTSSGPSSSNSNNAPSSISNNVVATQKPPERPKPKAPVVEKLECISQCDPAYPSVLNGVEGNASVQVNVDTNGNVTSVSLSKPNSNGSVNQEALLAAKKMKFTKPSNGNSASVQVNINFTVAGSDFDRQARERQQQQARERQAQLDKERQARQAQLERERQARQAQLEKERQERERQLQQESQVTPTPETEALETPTTETQEQL